MVDEKKITMNMWETEDEYTSATQANLPTPTDTPYRTPSRTSRSSRKKSKSPVPSSSPPAVRNGDKRNSKDISNDESISILDPRRFTPTLHANLVAEILALRRDQEEKIRLIENLESTLHVARTDSEELAETLTATGKETRSLQRQLALLEGGTSSALGELARERDEAVETAAETRKRLEATLKKSRLQQDELDRAHDLWSRDKDNWNDEKRKLERKVHVAENRLRTVLEEVAAFQAGPAAAHTNGDATNDDHSHDSGIGHGSDTASVRSMSLTNSIRFSMLNGPNGYGISKLNGVSLADELNLDTEDDETEADNDGRESVMSNVHRRNASRDSYLSKTHRRNESMDSLRRPGSVARGRLLATQATLAGLEGGIAEGDEDAVAEKPTYVDSGVQFSPPPSPQLKSVLINGSAIEPIAELDSEKILKAEVEVEANQARKRVHTTSGLLIETTTSGHHMVSSASQTMRVEPMSPPRTPKSPSRAPPPIPDMTQYVPEQKAMISMSTQTDAPPSPLLVTQTESPPRPLIPIPYISVHPPTSRPSTPRPSLLPQYFKDAGCQTSLPLPVSMVSVSVQTENIRVDERISLLPKHLQPSTINSAPPSPEPQAIELDRGTTAGKIPPPRNPRRMKSKKNMTEISSSPPGPLRQMYESYPGNNDDGPLSTGTYDLKRPPRVSSLFAGFDGASSDDADDYEDAELSENENGFRTALSAPRPKHNLNNPPKPSAPMPVLEDVEPSKGAKSRQGKPKKQSANFDSQGTFMLQESPAQFANKTESKSLAKRASIEKFQSHMTASTAKQGTMRRATLIQNGIMAHQGRARSPSLGSLQDPVKEPPFPIPDRASSRKPPYSTSSAPSDGNRSPTPKSGEFSYRRGSRNHSRTGSVRKSRSAAHLSSQRTRRRESRSPPPFSTSSIVPESPQLPPMPRNDITTPQFTDSKRSSRYIMHRKQPSTNTAVSSNTNDQSVGGSNQATSVVDAIAQTMVGEWMFKYVRRRKSFGVSDNTAFESDAANGVRHKRWVWVAPYERAVMWSSKQPTSGSALMGKSGRKCKSPTEPNFLITLANHTL